MICPPVINPGGDVVQVVAVVWDATGSRRLQQKIDAIDKAGRELGPPRAGRASTGGAARGAGGRARGRRARGEQGAGGGGGPGGGGGGRAGEERERKGRDGGRG